MLNHPVNCCSTAHRHPQPLALQWPVHVYMCIHACMHECVRARWLPLWRLSGTRPRRPTCRRPSPRAGSTQTMLVPGTIFVNY